MYIKIIHHIRQFDRGKGEHNNLNSILQKQFMFTLLFPIFMDVEESEGKETKWNSEL